MCAFEIARNAQLYYEALIYYTRRRQYGSSEQELPIDVHSIKPPRALRKRFSYGIMPDQVLENAVPQISYRRYVQITYGAISLDS